MATDTRTITFDSSTDVNFRAWGLSLSQALQACGLVQHTDTGQINWTTHVRTLPTSTEAIQGYEMFRFNDSLQATKPVFIKVEYAFYTDQSTPRATGIPAVLVTVGTATNGAGTLVAPIVGQRTRFFGNAPATGINATGGQGTPSNATPVHTQGDGSSIVMALGASATAQFTMAHPTGFTVFSPFPALLVIERSRDAGGVANGDGVCLLTSAWMPSVNSGTTVATNPTATTQFISFTGALVSATGTQWPVTWPNSAWGTGTVGADVYTYPLKMVTPKPQHGLAVIGTYKSDFSLGSIFSLFHMGANHTYRSLAGIAGTANNDNARSYVNSIMPTAALLMRWE